MELEAAAIDLVLNQNRPCSKRPGNKGFDLIETDAGGEPERWIGVGDGRHTDREARGLVASSIRIRPPRPKTNIGSTSSRRRIAPVNSGMVKIQKPAGRAGSFTFDAAKLCCCPRNIHRSACSLRDVQLLPGHRSIETTERSSTGTRGRSDDWRHTRAAR
jgi:hypothetical protein